MRDHLVVGCLNDKICERLFLKPEDLTLQNAIVVGHNGTGYLEI